MKCIRPTCGRLEQTGGYCKPHYRAEMRAKNIPIGMVSTAPVIEHMAKLSAAGVGMHRASQLADLPLVTVWRIANRQKCVAGTAQKILSIPIPAAAHRVVAPGAFVPAIGTLRRLQALHMLGHRSEDIAEVMNVNARTVDHITAGKQKFVTADVACRAERAFNTLQLIPGPSKITKSRSLRKGWHPPFAWDEDQIDNPEAKPYIPDVGRDDWVGGFEEMKALGYTNKQIAEDLGISRDALLRRLARYRDRTAA